MKPSSRSSKQQNRTREKEEFAIRAVFNAMYAVGVTATNAKEAEEAIDLATILLSYALRREVTKSELHDRMLALIAEHEAEMETKH